MEQGITMFLRSGLCYARLLFFQPPSIMPPWLPWVIVGGIVFMLLSLLASKYQEKEHKAITFAQDFVSGGIVVALLGVLVPDAFPAFPLSVPNFTELVRKSDEGEMDVQLGPIRR